jgi:hypothetical protein
MPSDPPVGPLTDIRENIRLAFSFIADASVDQFLADRRTVYAVTLPGDYLRSLTQIAGRDQGTEPTYPVARYGRGRQRVPSWL